ncbi:S66 peptidase family protein [Paenibacillus sp. L3-i20]|uniref:S66 family peptidase n=1 Tax=Paenibacillus sp. L3-i20 TaxID=2905833 RepID=UPI001EE0A8B6|nr:S66 peptidase family protein [Paenibacillus sp. L3-i20]GKU78415.1 putative carboxypeptidase YocD [Paenibacillus sp. L3-i20]
MKAAKLIAGDEIRIISPSRSMSMIAVDHRNIAKARLEEMGFKVSFSEHSLESDQFVSSSVRSRIEDLHAAFADPNVKGILTTIGGFNSNQLLRHIDYELIKANPKRLCGYSDITALSNAIFAKTGLITYSGPHFSTLAMLHGNEYTMDYFKKIMMQDAEIKISPSGQWSDDAWYMDQEIRSFTNNEGPYVINAGAAEGTIIGGNQCTFNLLQGTEYMPNLKNAILFLEDDYEVQPHAFDRDLQSLIHQPSFEGVKGIVIGRFQKSSNMTKELLQKIIKSKVELDHIPVIADMDFGHTSPLITFPVGGKVSLHAFDNTIEVNISE